MHKKIIYLCTHLLKVLCYSYNIKNKATPGAFRRKVEIMKIEELEMIDNIQTYTYRAGYRAGYADGCKKTTDDKEKTEQQLRNEIVQLQRKHINAVDSDMCETARKIKEYCHNIYNCSGCVFNNIDKGCVIGEKQPEDWEV